VLEKLEYVPPEIIGSSPYLVVEGITDFYALKYVQDDTGLAHSFSLIPGSGAGALGPLISLLLGRGDRFLILLDDDPVGIASARRYREEWFLSEKIVQTLGDFDSKFRKKTLERLISPETKKMIQAKLNKAKAPTKKEIGLYLSEMCASGKNEGVMSTETRDTLLHILKAAEQKLKEAFVGANGTIGQPPLAT
jgi:hypothetical protein